jgi:hypothetical protein
MNDLQTYKRTLSTYFPRLIPDVIINEIINYLLLHNKDIVVLQTRFGCDFYEIIKFSSFSTQYYLQVVVEYLCQAVTLTSKGEILAKNRPNQKIRVRDDWLEQIYWRKYRILDETILRELKQAYLLWTLE